MDFTNDFKDYATKHKGLNTLQVEDYMDLQIKASQTPYIIEERPMNITQLDVFSRLMMDRYLFLTGGVDQRMADITQAQLLYLESVDKKKDITILVNSPGGAVYAGLGIKDVMDYVAPDIATINLGMAASMGSIILSSGTKGKRSGLITSRVMIHQVSSGNQGKIFDNRVSHMESEKYNYILFKILAENSGKSFEEVLAAAETDKWLNSNESLNFGFIDEIIGVDKNKSIDDYMVGFDDYLIKQMSKVK